MPSALAIHVRLVTFQERDVVAEKREEKGSRASAQRSSLERLIGLLQGARRRHWYARLHQTQSLLDTIFRGRRLLKRMARRGGAGHRSGELPERTMKLENARVGWELTRNAGVQPCWNRPVAMMAARSRGSTVCSRCSGVNQ